MPKNGAEKESLTKQLSLGLNDLPGGGKVIVRHELVLGGRRHLIPEEIKIDELLQGEKISPDARRIVDKNGVGTVVINTNRQKPNST